VTIDEVWTGYGFIGHIHTPLGTTSNYNAIANLTPPAKPFPACCVLTSCPLVTSSNSGDSSAYRAQVLPSTTLVHNCLPPLLSLPCIVQLHIALNFRIELPTLNSLSRFLNYYQLAWGPRYIASGWTQQKTAFPNNPSIVACVFVAAGTCLPRHCLAIDVHSGSTIPAFRRHARIRVLSISP
jgi:hypothetical protein